MAGSRAESKEHIPPHSFGALEVSLGSLLCPMQDTEPRKVTRRYALTRFLGPRQGAQTQDEDRCQEPGTVRSHVYAQLHPRPPAECTVPTARGCFIIFSLFAQ